MIDKNIVLSDKIEIYLFIYLFINGKHSLLWENEEGNTICNKNGRIPRIAIFLDSLFYERSR